MEKPFSPEKACEMRNCVLVKPVKYEGTSKKRHNQLFRVMAQSPGFISYINQRFLESRH